MAETAFYHTKIFFKMYEILNEGKPQHRFYVAEYLTISTMGAGESIQWKTSILICPSSQWDVSPYLSTVVVTVQLSPPK